MDLITEGKERLYARSTELEMNENQVAHESLELRWSHNHRPSMLGAQTRAVSERGKMWGQRCWWGQLEQAQVCGVEERSKKRCHWSSHFSSLWWYHHVGCIRKGLQVTTRSFSETREDAGVGTGYPKEEGLGFSNRSRVQPCRPALLWQGEEYTEVRPRQPELCRKPQQ